MLPFKLNISVPACLLAMGLTLGLASAAQAAEGTVPTGSVKGSAWEHTPESLQAVVSQAAVVLPEKATGGARYTGTLAQAPLMKGQPVPVVLFLHGSSGLGLKAIGEWQQWLADLGVASVAPNSFALPDRVTYTSPISVGQYERIHALRLSEIAPTLRAIRQQPWADTQHLILAGASEGAVPVARYEGDGFMARMVFSWSCESNYFVQAPRNAFVPGQPVLNIISSRDPYFSSANPWLQGVDAQGHCGKALKDNPRASILLIPDAPHTLLNLPAARDATSGFLSRIGAR